MKGQKQAVVDLVKAHLPTFIPFKNIALVMLTKDQLEDIKRKIAEGIMDASIEYGKLLIPSEVASYARSMTMNHLKKARELNGNQVYTTNPTKALAKQEE